MEIEKRIFELTGETFYVVDLHRATGIKLKLFSTLTEAENFIKQMKEEN